MNPFLLLAIVLSLGVAVSVSAQEIETATHTFEIEEPTPPAPEVLERVGDLSEKYVMGTITEAELVELKSLKDDLTELDMFRQHYELGRQAVNTGEPVAQDTAGGAEAAADVPVAAVPEYNFFFLIVYVTTIINTVLTVIALLAAFRRRN